MEKHNKNDSLLHDLAMGKLFSCSPGLTEEEYQARKDLIETHGRKVTPITATVGRVLSNSRGVIGSDYDLWLMALNEEVAHACAKTGGTIRVYLSDRKPISEIILDALALAYEQAGWIVTNGTVNPHVWVQEDPESEDKPYRYGFSFRLPGNPPTLVKSPGMVTMPTGLYNLTVNVLSRAGKSDIVDELISTAKAVEEARTLHDVVSKLSTSELAILRAGLEEARNERKAKPFKDDLFLINYRIKAASEGNTVYSTEILNRGKWALRVDFKLSYSKGHPPLLTIFNIEDLPDPLHYAKDFQLYHVASTPEELPQLRLAFAYAATSAICQRIFNDSDRSWVVKVGGSAAEEYNLLEDGYIAPVVLIDEIDHLHRMGVEIHRSNIQDVTSPTYRQPTAE